MRRRSPSRWLAPLALAACAVAVYVLVHQGVSPSEGTSTPTVSTAASRTATTPKRTGGKRSRTYIVKSGDVLSVIAAKHGTTVAELQRLNPSVDAAALHPGQKLKLP
jgi:LysM repeat protein